jgi:hypothetical protein
MDWPCHLRYSIQVQMEHLVVVVQLMEHLVVEEQLMDHLVV